MPTQDELHAQKIAQLRESVQPEFKAETVRQYQAHVNRLTAKALVDRTTNEDEFLHITPEMLVADWISNLTKVSTATSNTHRSALMWAFKYHRDAGWEEAYLKIEGIRPNTISKLPREHANVEDLGEGSKNTRAPGRMISEEDTNRLCNALAGMQTDWGAYTQWFFMAGLASGARPGEWVDAEWIDTDQTVLRIYTSKVKTHNPWKKIPPLTFTAEDEDNELAELYRARPNKAEHSPEWYEIDFLRRISTCDLTEDEVQELLSTRYRNGTRLFRDVEIEPQYRMFVRLHLDNVKKVLQEHRDKYGADETISDAELFKEHYYNRARHCCWRAAKKTFEGDPDARLFSLADTRSTFSANRKARDGLAAAAASAGHSVTTAKDYYAPASKSWSRYRAPVPGALPTVAVTKDMLKARRTNQARPATTSTSES